MGLNDAALRRGALSVGIVVYRSDPALLEACLLRLADSVAALAPAAAEVLVIDNGPPESSPGLAEQVARIAAGPLPYALRVLSGHGNVGYGIGSNLAIERSDAEWHLVLNPDAELERDALRHGVARLEADSSIAMVAAWTLGADGQVQRLVKTYPSLLVLAMRALGLPWFARRVAAYDVMPGPGEVTDVTGRLVSGSFMLCRTEVLKAVGGFDPAYFLYFEDFDLSLRMAREGRLVWARDVRVVHHGGASASKGWLHVRLFARSAATFFARHGWKLW